MLRKIAITMSMLFVLAPSVGHAFKTATHVWVGQQVLEDVVPDGRVTIPPFGEFAVRPDIVAALRSYPNEFRMGNVGPDGFPDIVTGQITVHPGVPNHWQADDWLKWITQPGMRPQDLAFAYGYLGHAAADVFAHTYINSYSGDIFNLKDGEDFVEKRHIGLESFI